MDPGLIEDGALSLSRKSRLPGRGFFEPEEPIAAEAAREAGTLDAAERVIVTDPDPDGLACAALIRTVRGAGLVIPTGPHDLAEALETIAESPSRPAELYVCDLSADALDVVADSLSRLTESGVRVSWYDHHQWDGEVAEGVRELGVALRIGDGTEVCSADVALRALDGELPAHLVELVTVTRDHDLWIKEDPRSDDLADYAYWATPTAYLDAVSEHGPDLPTDALALLEERREEKAALIDLAIDRARIVEIGEYAVGLTYGRCSQNEVAEGLREQGADAAVIVKPSGSASIRGSSAFERCHEVAERVGGGGHPRAAGCKPDIYGDMLDYAHHWVTEGAITQRTLLDAFEAVLEDD